MTGKAFLTFLGVGVAMLALSGCTTAAAVTAVQAAAAAVQAATPPTAVPALPVASNEPRSPEGHRYLSQPLVTEIFTADPSAHVFNNRIYIYGSHDIDGTTPEDDLGAHFEMRDYRVL